MCSRTLSAIALAVAGAVAFIPGGDAQSAGAPPQTFAFAIGNGMLAGGQDEVSARLGAFDLVVVDGELARRAEVAALRAGGATVLGYLSVGTIERWRSWYRSVRRFRLEAWEDWRDEWFADVSKRGLRRRYTRRIAPALLAKGFDGLFLDNVDMIEARNHRDQRTGMRRLVARLDSLADRHGALVFAQNGHWGMDRFGITPYLDGWNREDVTWGYDFDRRRYFHRSEGAIRRAQSEMRDFAARGLVVTATDYTRAGDLAARDEAIENACAAGALPYVSDIGLTARRLPDPPLTCP